MKINNIYFITLSLLSLLYFTGCSKKLNKTTPIKVEKKMQKESIPQWVLTPNIDGYVGGVGITKVISNKRKQEKLVVMSAKAALTKNIKVKIDSELVKKADNKGEKDVTSIKKLSSSQMLGNLKKKASWIDKNNNYYIWMVIDNEY